MPPDSPTPLFPKFPERWTVDVLAAAAAAAAASQRRVLTIATTAETASTPPRRSADDGASQAARLENPGCGDFRNKQCLFVRLPFEATGSAIATYTHTRAHTRTHAHI